MMSDPGPPTSSASGQSIGSEAGPNPISISVTSTVPGQGRPRLVTQLPSASYMNTSSHSSAGAAHAAATWGVVRPDVDGAADDSGSEAGGSTGSDARVGAPSPAPTSPMTTAKVSSSDRIVYSARPTMDAAITSTIAPPSIAPTCLLAILHQFIHSSDVGEGLRPTWPPLRVLVSMGGFQRSADPRTATATSSPKLGQVRPSRVFDHRSWRPCGSSRRPVICMPSRSATPREATLSGTIFAYTVPTPCCFACASRPAAASVA